MTIKRLGGFAPAKRPLFYQSAALIAFTFALPGVAHAAGTAAGTTISNTASASFDTGGGPTTVDSNQVDLLVDELLDVTVGSDDPGDVITTPGATGQVLTYTVTNTGNGPEAFTLGTVNVAGDDFDTVVTQIVIDDGDGVYEPGVDVVYVPGSNDPLLAADASVTIFVIATTPGTVTDGDQAIVQLTAEANTGTGAPGDSFAGAGEGGGDAVVGSTGADGVDDGTFEVSSASIDLVKSAVVLNQFGGTESVPGATITYTIVATTTGSGSLSNVDITDAIPAGTTYVPSSLTLGGTSLTDPADADAGTFSGTGVAVELGTVPGGQTRTVTFQVIVD